MAAAATIVTEIVVITGSAREIGMRSHKPNSTNRRRQASTAGVRGRPLERRPAGAAVIRPMLGANIYDTAAQSTSLQGHTMSRLSALMPNPRRTMYDPADAETARAADTDCKGSGRPAFAIALMSL